MLHSCLERIVVFPNQIIEPYRQIGVCEPRVSLAVCALRVYAYVCIS